MAVNDAVEALKGAFPTAQVVLPGTDAFKTHNTSYLSKAQAELQPRAIFLPRDRDDVVKFVRVIGPYSLQGSMKLAVRGAGQQPALGCNNVDDGITVDLRNLTGILLEEDDATVSIGAGERWGDVYSKLQEKGFAVTGSRSSMGGIGGLALSGKDSRYVYSPFYLLNAVPGDLLEPYQVVSHSSPLEKVLSRIM